MKTCPVCMLFGDFSPKKFIVVSDNIMTLTVKFLDCSHMTDIPKEGKHGN